MVASAFLTHPITAAQNDRWIKVSTPEFTVITTLPEKRALVWSNEFSQFVKALQSFITVNPRRLPPLTLVVFAREKDYALFKPLRENGSTMDVAAFFSRRPSWAVAGLVEGGMRDEMRATIFHEGTHWFLSGLDLPNPVWLEEGLAEVFSTFAIEGKNVTWGRAIEAHVHALRMYKPMSLEQLLFLPRETLHGEGDQHSLQTGMAYAQSWAFVHYLTFGQRDVPKESLVQYVTRLRLTNPDAAFREAFGGSYADVDKKLRVYLSGGRYFTARQPLASLPPIQAISATVADVEQALTRLRMAGRRQNEAQANVERLIAAEPLSPRGYELQGELALESGNPEFARTAFQKAVDHGSNDFRPYYELALSGHAGVTEPDGTVRSLTPDTARQIANRYEQAINLNPRHLPSYRGLAGVVGIVPPNNTEDSRFLEIGLKLFPGDGMIRLGLATIAKREGDPIRARELLDAVLASENNTTDVTNYARRLDSAWIEADVFTRLNTLRKEKRFDEAVTFIDEQIKGGVNFALAQRLHVIRSDVQVSVVLEQARVAFVEGRADEAREKLQAVLESNASPLLKNQVRRQLETLNKQKAKKSR